MYCHLDRQIVQYRCLFIKFPYKMIGLGNLLFNLLSNQIRIPYILMSLNRTCLKSNANICQKYQKVKISHSQVQTYRFYEFISCYAIEKKIKSFSIHYINVNPWEIEKKNQKHLKWKKKTRDVTFAEFYAFVSSMASLLYIFLSVWHTF